MPTQKSVAPGMAPIESSQSVIVRDDSGRHPPPVFGVAWWCQVSGADLTWTGHGLDMGTSAHT